MIYSLVAVMFVVFALSTMLSCAVAALVLRGYVWAAALIVIAYLVSCLGMVIYALS